MNEVIMYAVSLADTPYVYGGSTPVTGFDCSGFVVHVFKQTLGVSLPRTSAEIGQSGIPINSKQLRPGDLVFFNTQRQANSHVGIFVGEGKFVHAPKKGSRIRVEKMQGKYWASRYNGARRIKA
ncbi:MAG: C40 family peptidase [Gallionellaceae bacterium]